MTRLMPSAETKALMLQQRITLLRDPSRAELPAELDRAERYIFRTRPGTIRRLIHILDVIPEAWENKHADFYRKRWLRRHPDEKDRKRLAALADRLGGVRIAFQRVERHHECFFATDDPLVATYLRERMQSRQGDWQHVYEENGDSVLRTTDGTIFPDSAMGRQSAMEYAKANGGQTVEFVSNAAEAA